ncbi:MAG: hypothetical protein ACRC37_08100 [Lentisphaeria bacterium]
MNKKEIKKLSKEYKRVCEDYVKIFCNKQDMDFDGWAADVVGEVAWCNDFYFNFSDIVLDVNTWQPKGLIVEWYYSLNDDFKPNYSSYTLGFRKRNNYKSMSK